MRPHSRPVSSRGPKILLSLVLGPALALMLVSPRRTVASPAEPTPARPARETISLATSVVTPFFGAYYLEGKLIASDSFVVVANASYLTLANAGWKNRAGTVGLGAEYFFRGEAMRGWYAEIIGEAWFSSWRHEQSGVDAPISLGTAVVAVAGYHFPFGRGFVLDVGLGAVGVYLPAAHVELPGGRVSSQTFTKLYPAAKVNVGWAF